MKVSFAHTNIVAKDWRRLARFYIDVFNRRPKPPERDLAGDWLDRLTGIDNVQIQGMHLEMPGAVEGGPIHLVYAKDPEGNIIEIQKWE